MPRILLAVLSCHHMPEFADAIRNTWAPRVQGADLRFFLGRGTNSPKGDEVHLDCDDSRGGIPEKVQSILRWAYDNGYDFVSKIDHDVVMDPVRFLALIGHNDFMGMGKSPDGTAEDIAMPYGYCYTLSRAAMKVIIDRPLPQNDVDFEAGHRDNDEYWIAWVLQRAGVYLHVEWSCRLWDGLPSIYPELPDTTVFCVHMHRNGRMTRPEEVHEMCRIWRDRLSGPNE
jgi:hypothetical protein